MIIWNANRCSHLREYKIIINQLQQMIPSHQLSPNLLSNNNMIKPRCWFLSMLFLISTTTFTFVPSIFGICRYSCSRVGRRGPQAPPWWQNFNGTQRSLSLPGLWKHMLPSAKIPPRGTFGPILGPKGPILRGIGVNESMHINWFEWPCNMSK